MNRCKYCGTPLDSNEEMESHAGDNCKHGTQAMLYQKFKEACVDQRIVKDNQLRYRLLNYSPVRGMYVCYILDTESNTIVSDYEVHEREEAQITCNGLNAKYDVGVTVVSDTLTWVSKTPDEMWDWILKEIMREH